MQIPEEIHLIIISYLDDRSTLITYADIFNIKAAWKWQLILKMRIPYNIDEILVVDWKHTDYRYFIYIFYSNLLRYERIINEIKYFKIDLGRKAKSLGYSTIEDVWNSSDKKFYNFLSDEYKNVSLNTLYKYISIDTFYSIGLTNYRTKFNIDLYVDWKLQPKIFINAFNITKEITYDEYVKLRLELDA